MRALKNDGSYEELDISKGTKSLKWAIGDLKGVSTSEIEMQSKLHFYDGISTAYILDVYIKTCYDLSSLRDINYDAVCKNLKLQKLYKNIFKGVKPCSIKEFIAGKEKIYNQNIYRYSDKELALIEQAIDHSRDFNFTASGLDAVTEGYGLKDTNEEPCETPQMIYMLIAMDAFYGDFNEVINLYEALSNFKITLPTPEMKAYRTHSSDYASCCTVRIGDSIDSWNEGSTAIVSHTVASAGVGVAILDIASIGDPVKDGKIIHGGKIKVLKSIDTDIAKASQNGRRGSGTAFLNFFDPEIEEIMSIKSPRTALDKRINDLSYGICMHEVLYERAMNAENITLLSTRQAPELVNAIASKDPMFFKVVYESAEKKFPDAKKIPAQDFFKLFATERFENSAYYVVNIDEANINTPYLDEIIQSNICVEFLTPTLELSSKEPDAPAIGICVLANGNQTLIPISDLPNYTRILVKLQTRSALRQNHPTSQANAFVKGYRDIGIGFSNHANWLAENGWKYGQQEALDAHFLWMQHFQFGLMKASMEIAKKDGPAPLFHKTNWKKLMPLDRVNKNALALVNRFPELEPDWDWLKGEIQIYGMANCGLSMVPPAESSSIPSNQTSALEPIRELLTIKDKKGKNHKQYAPKAMKLADKYDYAFDRKITRDFFKHVAITQMLVDKSISAGAFYNPKLYPNEKVDIKEIISDIHYLKFLGGKTLYYNNTAVPDGAEADLNGCQEGCSV